MHRTPQNRRCYTTDDDDDDDDDKRECNRCVNTYAYGQMSRVLFFGSSVNIRRWTYVRYYRTAMAQKLFSTGPGGQNEKI